MKTLPYVFVRCNCGAYNVIQIGYPRGQCDCGGVFWPDQASSESFIPTSFAPSDGKTSPDGLSWAVGMTRTSEEPR